MRAVWFVVGFVITYVAITAIAVNKPAGLRGARVGGEWFPVHENDTLLNAAAVGIVAAAVGLLILARRPLRLPWALLIGQCFALLADLIVLLST